MKKKLLITASGFSHIVSFHLPYVEAFSKLGWEVHVACGGEVRDIPYADKLISIPFKKHMFSLDNFRACLALHRLYRENGYDLLITHTSLAAFFSRLALFGVKKSTKVINVVHGYLFDGNERPMKRFLLQSAEKLTAKYTDLILTMNHCDYEWACANSVAAEVKSIPGMGIHERSGTDAKPDAWPDLSEDDFVLIFPAEFSARKNQSMLIKALARLPDNVKLLLPGKGSMLDECRTLADSLGLGGRVFFPGHVDNITAWFAMSDVAVSSSRYEGLPFNVMEAMQCALPVIASNVKGNADLVEHGVSGLLYEYDNAGDFADAVMLLMNDERLRSGMAQKGLEKAREYELDKVFPLVMQEYLSLF